VPLKAIRFPAVLETSTDDILKSFVVPSLQASTSFDRGVGFFTSQWLKMAAHGLSSLAARGGKTRLIASPKLEANDWAALAQGAAAINDPQLHQALTLTIDELENELIEEPVRALSWMIADGLMEIRLAIPANALDGDFHDKFGIFADSNGDRVAFHGSMNESAQAFRNYEGLDVFTSWENESDATRVRMHEARFERLWTNADINVRVYELPDAIRRNLVEFAERTERPYPDPRAANVQATHLWRHQDEAVAAFLGARSGILEMATGTGKTRTAIRILNELKERHQIDFAIICAGGPDLLNQWRQQLGKETSSPLYCTYGGMHDEVAFLNQNRDAIWIASREALTGLLAHVPPERRARTLLICDEVHGLGAPAIVQALAGVIGTFGYRLGLSATPDREYDAAGNAFIEAEVGAVIFRFGLEEAIRRGILCEFDYVPLPYIFLDEDKMKVRNVIATYHARVNTGQPVSKEWLWLSISRIAKEAPNKIPVFRAYLKKTPESLRRTLIFVETIAFGEAVQPIIMEHTRDFHTYYGSDDEVHLRRFAQGSLTVLLTAHRISEGIDIKAVDTIVLFSASRARLETIQRLGRCLRTDATNTDKRALVIDFIRADVEEREGAEYGHADRERSEWLSKLAAVRRDQNS
jgi:superfamily II DNA or RNA helicase